MFNLFEILAIVVVIIDVVHLDFVYHLFPTCADQFGTHTHTHKTEWKSRWLIVIRIKFAYIVRGEWRTYIYMIMLTYS